MAAASTCSESIAAARVSKRNNASLTPHVTPHGSVDNLPHSPAGKILKRELPGLLRRRAAVANVGTAAEVVAPAPPPDLDG